MLQGGQFVCSLLPARDRGEHSFYWKAVKDHPSFSKNPLFHQNSERDPFSDCTHRNFSNYTDHINFFGAVEFPDIEDIATAIEKIRRIRRHSVTQPCRDDYPDLFNVQILAYQRIVTYREYMDARIHGNRFWNAHRDPAWCKGILHFQLEDQPLDAVGA